MIQRNKQENLNGIGAVSRHAGTQREGRANVYRAGSYVVCLMLGRYPHLALPLFAEQRRAG